MEVQYILVMVLKDFEFDEVKEKLKEKEQFVDSLVEKLQREIDCCERKIQEVESKIVEFLLEK